jgi:hypothetical protein
VVSTEPPAEGPGAETEASVGPELGALLVCFTQRKAAAKARRPLEAQLRSSGDAALDTTVLQVDKTHKASVHDPHRVILGTLTSLLTWGLFGLVSGGITSLVISALLGALWGGGIAYYRLHHVTKAQLGRLGKQLPAPSSALLTFAETSDSRRLLAAAAHHRPSTASVAVIADDLSARVFVGDADGVVEIPRRSPDSQPSSNESARLSLILFRYPDDATAKQVASRIAASDETENAPRVELVVQTDPSGRRHVTDPEFGVGAVARYNVVSWGGLGLICGALAGVTGSSGLLGFLKGGLVTGLAWGLFGLAAGALYGLWAGRATSARELERVGPILAPDTSTLLVWFEGRLNRDTIDTLAAGTGTQRLILSFELTEAGALLEAA